MTTTNLVAPTVPISLEHRIIDTISWRLNLPPIAIRPYTRFRDDLLLDPVDLTLLIAELETRLNLYLTPEEVDMIETVADASRYFGAHAA